MEYDWGEPTLWDKVINWIVLIVAYALAFGGLAWVLTCAGCPMWPW